MRLTYWLKRKKMSSDEFAVLIGVHPTTIYRFENGLSFPKSANLKRITEVTDGAVKPNDFVNIERPPPTPGRGRPRKSISAFPGRDRLRNIAKEGDNDDHEQPEQEAESA